MYLVRSDNVYTDTLTVRSVRLQRANHEKLFLPHIDESFWQMLQVWPFQVVPWGCILGQRRDVNRGEDNYFELLQNTHSSSLEV